MTTHLALDGALESCPSSEDCALPIHMDLSVEAAKQLPERFIEQLAEASDPPSRINEETGAKVWLNEAGNAAHREYGLPAVINADGARIWRIRGQLHRIGKPAVVTPEGRTDYWENGIRIHGNIIGGASGIPFPEA